ncbi:MAG: DoxX family protein [Candidatus Pacearchaeota archaeon]
MNKEYAKFGPTLIRVFLGLLMLIPGISKLMNTEMPIGMLTNLGFPAPIFLAWVLLLSEIIFGVSVIIGWKVKYTIWPLVIVLTVATIFVVIPNMNGNPVNLLFHLSAIAGLISLFLTGPGALSLDKK